MNVERITVKPAKKVRPLIFSVIMLVAANVLASATTIGVTVPDLTWPLIFNGIAPFGIIAYFASKYMASNDAIHKELIDSKNDMEARLTVIETTHRNRGCDGPQSK